ncbi:Sperm motility kinase 3 [Heterocephalus glaber]|uniref:non-specific serine/threonine protein kinase n=1 Tax=Heterocephalus glaber TaxID=10181 RepID=G5BJW6_HETGA|nr:Sperm motility kinase 3 [Heterocephalus glaber]
MWPLGHESDRTSWLGLSTSSSTDSLQENYEVLRLLDKGGFGEILLAKHRGTGMLVAVKAIVKTKMPAACIISEVGMLKDLQHPNIIQLLEVIESKDKVYLVLEYVTGGNLWGWIRRTENHRLPEEEARGIFRDIAGAVDYCHTQGIVHADLKPQNVLIDAEGHAKICDFGVGSRFLPGQDVALTYGTRKYCAPEWLLPESYRGPPLDVWSLGIILFELLMGPLPFNWDTPQMRAILSGRCSCPQSISRDAQDLIWNLMHSNPRMWPTVQEVLQHHWLQGVPPPSPPELLPMAPQMAINVMDGMGFNPREVVDSVRTKEMTLPQSQGLQGPPLRVHVKTAWAPEDEDPDEIASSSTAPAPSSLIPWRSASSPVTCTGLLFPGVEPTGRQGGGSSQSPIPIPRTPTPGMLCQPIPAAPRVFCQPGPGASCSRSSPTFTPSSRGRLCWKALKRSIRGCLTALCCCCLPPSGRHQNKVAQM